MKFFKTELTQKDLNWNPLNNTNNLTNTITNTFSNTNLNSVNSYNNTNTNSISHNNCKLRLEKIEMENIENRKKYGYGDSNNNSNFVGNSYGNIFK